jgi:hypothetical protein
MIMNVLLALGFRNAYSRVTQWLKSNQWSSLFLPLPEDFEPFLSAFSREEITEGQLWQAYAILTGLPEPFINALRYRIDPLIQYLSEICGPRSGRDVFCYHDLRSHVESSKIAEKILLMEFRARAKRRIDPNEWRRILMEELNLARDNWKMLFESIADRAINRSPAVLCYDGSLRRLKSSLLKMGFKAEIINLGTCWRSPLDVLRVMLSNRGPDGVNNAEIEQCVREQISYLNLVMRSRNIDEDHETWTQMQIKQCLTTNKTR